MKKYLFSMFILLGMLVSLTSCSSDEKNDDNFSISQSEVVVNVKTGSAQLSASPNDVEWSSENPYVAAVTKSGKVLGIHVGETNIVASRGGSVKKCKVTVTPQYTTFKEPLIEFGKSKEYIISKLGTPDKQFENMIAYGNRDDFQVTFYEFSKGKLSKCMVSLDASNEKVLQLPIFFMERYEMRPEKVNGMWLYYNASRETDATTLVLLDEEVSGGRLWVYYTKR